MRAVWPRPYLSQTDRCQLPITSFRRDGSPQPDYRLASRRFEGSPWHLNSLSPPAPVKGSAAIMFIYAFIGLQPLRKTPFHPPQPLLSFHSPITCTSELTRQLLSHKRALACGWRQRSAEEAVGLMLSCKRNHTPTHISTHAHARTNYSDLPLTAFLEKSEKLLSASLLSFLWASAMHEIKNAK